MSILNLILDIILLILFIGCIIRCTKNGLIRSLFRTLRVFISFALGIVLNHPVSAWLQKLFLTEKVRGWVSGWVDPAVTDAAQLKAAIPESLQSVMSFFGVSADKLAQDAAGSAGNAAEQFVNACTTNISAILGAILAFFAIFAVAFVLCIILGAVLNGIFSLPVLRVVNRLGGFAVGVVGGFCWTWSAAQLFILLGSWLTFIPFVAEQFNVESSVLLKFFQSINPLSWILAAIL